ncbi:hypothetical protein [Microbacterium sp. B35-04]|nr:hypothetical protein [Microbacterium sp. B35-04]
MTLAPESTSALFTGVLDLPDGPLDLSRHVAIIGLSRARRARRAR